MGKKVIRLTEDELRAAIKHSLNETLNEIDGATYARIYNSTINAQRNQLNGIESNNPKKSNMDIILQGVKIDSEAADSLISPYKTDYLFHCQNLRGTAAITVFTLKELYLLRPDKAILKGDILFNNERLYGSIIVEFPSNAVYYNYKGKTPKYRLQIDLSKKELWDKLLGTLKQSIDSRI